MNSPSESPYKNFDDEDVQAPLVDEKPTQDVDAKMRLEKESRPKSKLWIVTAILSGIFFGLANLFMGATSYAGFLSQEIISVGSLIVGLMYLTLMLLQSKHKNGYCWRWEKSYYCNPQTKGINWLVVVIVAVLAFLFFFTGILILLTFEFALYGDLNQGIVSTLFSITSIYLAILFWIFYRQKMSLCDFAGMILLIASAIMMVFSKNDNAHIALDKADFSQSSVSPAWSVLFAILCTILFLIKALILKYSSEKLKIDTVDLVMTGYSIGGVVWLVPVTGYLITNGLDLGLYSQNLIAGVFECLGNIWISHAMITGIAGSASAFANLQVVVQIILDIILLNQIPNSIQIAAWVIGLSGAVVVSVGQVAINAIKNLLN